MSTTKYLGTSTSNSQYFLLPIKHQKSQPKSRFSSKAAFQLASLAHSRCVQKMCAAKHSCGSTREWDLILQACQSSTNLKEKCSFYLTLMMHWKQTHVFLLACHALKQPEWSAVLHWGCSLILYRNSLMKMESRETFSLALTYTAWRQMWLSRCQYGLDGLLAHTMAILLTVFLAQMRRSQFAEELNEILIQGEILIHAFRAIMRCLSCSVLCPIQKILTE